MPRLTNNQILTEAHHDFARGLSSYANGKVSNKVLSEDLVQTTFMKTWLYLQNTGKIDLMRAFLYHVMNRLIIDEYRKRKAVSLDILIEKGVEFEVAKPVNIFDLLDGKSLMALIEKLPEKYRSVITMRFTEDLTLKEMSAVTHLSQNTMSVQLHRGLAKLKVLYAGSLAYA